MLAGGTGRHYWYKVNPIGSGKPRSFCKHYNKPLEVRIEEKNESCSRKKESTYCKQGDSTWTWSFSNTGSDCFRSAALQHRLLPRLRRRMEQLGGMKPGPRPSEATEHAARCPAGLAPDDIPLNKIR